MKLTPTITLSLPQMITLTQTLILNYNPPNQRVVENGRRPPGRNVDRWNKTMTRRRRRRRRCDAARRRVAEESGEWMGNVRRLVGRCREKVLLASHASASGVITYEWSAFVFFGLCVHFRALKRLFARIVRLCGTRSDYRRWAVLIANAAQLRLFRSTWVDGYAVPKENNVLRWLLLFVAGTDQCSHYFRIRRQSKLWRQSARSRTCIQGFDGEHFYRLT